MGWQETSQSIVPELNATFQVGCDLGIEDIRIPSYENGLELRDVMIVQDCSWQ